MGRKLVKNYLRINKKKMNKILEERLDKIELLLKNEENERSKISLKLLKTYRNDIKKVAIENVNNEKYTKEQIEDEIIKMEEKNRECLENLREVVVDDYDLLLLSYIFMKEVLEILKALTSCLDVIKEQHSGENIAISISFE